MNMFRAFMELDEAYNDRQFHIDELKKAGKNYNFSKYTDAQLYRMCQRLQQPRVVVKEPRHELDLDFETKTDFDYCECGTRLTDFGTCPVCDLGEEDLTEALTEAAWSKFANNIDINILDNLKLDPPEDFERKFTTKCSESATKNALFLVSKGEPVKFVLGTIGDRAENYTGPITHCWLEYKGKIIQTRNDSTENLGEMFSIDLIPNDIEASKKLIVDLVNSINSGATESLAEWVSASGKSVSMPTSTPKVSTPSQTATVQSTTPANGKYTVRIVSHSGRLRALATDGTHPAAWVAFPNDLRQFEGQQYEVDQLIWNGKNYRVAGNIVEI